MKRSLLLLFALLFSLHSFGQEEDSVVVIFVITDQDGIGIDGVLLAVSQENSSQEFAANDKGEATCKVEKFGELKARFWHPDYARHTIIEDIYSNSKLDTLHFNVSLTSLNTLELEEVVVTAPGVPTVVYSSKQVSVQDFEIIDGDNAILLAYPKQLKKGSRLLLFDMDQTVKDSIEISEEAIELVRDYENHIYLIHTTGCKRIFVNENRLQTMDISYYYFRRYLEPIIGTSQNKMFFSNYDAFYPAFDYFFLNVDDSTYTKFASVVDEEMLTQYRSEYNFIEHRTDDVGVRRKLAAKNQELQTGVDAEKIFGRSFFTQSAYYQPPFAPMFKLDDYLFLFDYQCDSMKIFNDDGKQLSEAEITHDHDDRKKGWEKTLLHDRMKNRIYAVYQKNGFYFLHSINLTTGELRSPIKLNHRYAEGIQVHGGYIYYIYRPFESYQKKFFWKEKIPK